MKTPNKKYAPKRILATTTTITAPGAATATSAQQTKKRKRPITLGSGTSSAPELKVIDVDLGAIRCHTTGVLTLLNPLSLGTDFTNRLGRKIILKSIALRGYWGPYAAFGGGSTANAALAQQLRMMLIYDSDTNGAMPTIADVIGSQMAIGTNSFNNLNNRTRFRVLWDNWDVFSAVNSSGAAPSTFSGDPMIAKYNVYLDVQIPVIFNANNNGTITDINQGGIYLLTIGSNPSGVLDGTSFSRSRIRFIDN